MFNETSFPIPPVCGPGTTPVEVGADNPVCMTPQEASAYAQSVPSLGTVNVTPKPQDAWTSYLIYGVIAIAVLAMLKR